MGDLPEIRNGDQELIMQYANLPETHFQRLIRANATQLRDHMCKKMSPLVELRMSLIPLGAGSDWRDLPNASMVLPRSNGKYTPKLRYEFHQIFCLRYCIRLIFQIRISRYHPGKMSQNQTIERRLQMRRI